MRGAADGQTRIAKKRETPGGEAQPTEAITYERWLAIAVGQMGMAPESFYRLTPAEFIYAWLGWSDLERSRAEQAWERERWAVWILTTIQLDKKDRQPMAQMFPLPWESPPSQDAELTMEERRQRVKNILTIPKNETEYSADTAPVGSYLVQSPEKNTAESDC